MGGMGYDMTNRKMPISRQSKNFFVLHLKII